MFGEQAYVETEFWLAGIADATRIFRCRSSPQFTEPRAKPLNRYELLSGDTLALSRVLGPELVAISTGAPHWQSLRQTMTSSADFTAKGGKFVSVAFDSAMSHRFGDVVVMFSHYTVVTKNADKRSTQTGRATEAFVKTHGRWVHTSWHLDRGAQRSGLRPTHRRESACIGDVLPM